MISARWWKGKAGSEFFLFEWLVCRSGHLVPKNRGLKPSYTGNIRLYMNSGEFRYGLCLDCSKAPNLERLRLRWHHKRHWQRHWTKPNHLQCLERCRAMADLGAKGSITFSLWSFMRRGVGTLMKHCDWLEALWSPPLLPEGWHMPVLSAAFCRPLGDAWPGKGWLYLHFIGNSCESKLWLTQSHAGT